MMSYQKFIETDTKKNSVDLLVLVIIFYEIRKINIGFAFLNNYLTETKFVTIKTYIRWLNFCKYVLFLEFLNSDIHKPQTNSKSNVTWFLWNVWRHQ